MSNYYLDTPSHEIVAQAMKQPTWEAVCDLARVAREAQDNMQWLVGDLALAVMDHWGTDSVDDLAREAGYKKDTVMRYARVSKRWPPNKRNYEFSHSHHMVLASYEDRYQRIDQLQSGTSTEKLRRELVKETPDFKTDFLSIRILFPKSDLETIVKWYLKLVKHHRDELHDQDHLVAERLKQNFKKMMYLARGENQNRVEYDIDEADDQSAENTKVEVGEVIHEPEEA